jgi:hypothetical protein
MGRTLMYTAIGGLLILVLSSVFVLDHGGARIPVGGAEVGAESVSLHDLTTAAGIEKYGGRNVSTSGTLFFNSASNRHVLIAGDENYPVIIDSEGKLGQFEGKQVLVTGKFSLVAGAGPTIAATSVRLDSETPTPKDI